MQTPDPPPLHDLAAPAVVAVIATVEALAVQPARTPAVIAVELAVCLVLVFRRRWPMTVGTWTCAVFLLPFLGQDATDLTAPVLIVALAGFALGRYLPGLRGLPVMLLFPTVLVSAVALSGGEAWQTGDVLWIATLLLPPYVVGVVIRRFDDRHRRLTEQAEQLAASQERVRRETAAAERKRIARELHDVLAHSVSAMVVQTAAAEDLVRTDPDRVEQILREVTAVGRRALAETGRLLHLIRDADDDPGLQPDIGLDRLADLIAEFRNSGLEVGLSVEGDLAGLPAGIDLTAYRVVQEGLTNALRHGGGGTASVRLARTPDALDIRLENPDGHRNSSGGGLGLVGIAERVGVYGGTVRHGGTADGRYTMTVVLPVRAQEAEA